MTSPDPILGDLHDRGGPLPGDSVESRSVNLRWRRIPLWLVLMPVSVALAAAIPIRFATELGKPYIGGSEITGGVVFFVGSVGLALWMAWITPRVFTRQGVAVDAVGVALIQDPNLWFAGRTVRIPWGVIQSISEHERLTGPSGNQRKRRIVTLVVDADDHGIAVPSWASASPLSAPEGAPPRLRVDIGPGNSRQPKVLRALHAARPDLFA
ncbi:hypothetical protein [Streptomonospora litoralis]|uniref:PH domain-containing protein n=1 Tax=Streptomonospora litoralis TaxID=2498135 RepID=A0A4P6PXJ4_9ACTN|nr:hypothetical protein [Streptomonospora litoralis]QBI52410.1 hypothetical protein EKD16_02995 [Streptomonospora litoralis]